MLWAVVSHLSVLLKYVLLLLIAAYCWFRWSHRRLLSTAAKLPYFYPAFPIIGHAYFCLWGAEEFTSHLLKLTKKVVAKGVKTIVWWCGPMPLIVVHGIEDIKVVLNNSITIDKANEYEFIKFGLGDYKYSLLTAPGHIWRKLRKHMNPLFHPRNLQYMVPVFNQNSREFVSRLSGHVDQGSFNLLPYTMDTSLKTICNLLFGEGVEIEIKSKEFRGLIYFTETLPEMFISRLCQPWLRFDSVFHFLNRKKIDKLNFYLKRFTETTLQVAKSKMEQKQAKTTDGTASELPDSDFNEGMLNILDAFRTLQKSHPEFTEVDMWYELVNFYATGSDSVATTTAAFLLALAQYQDIQERLYEEVCRYAGSHDDVTAEDLKCMPYLDQVLKESLRWFSIVPFIGRRAGEDIELSTCTIPAGSTIAISLMGMNRDPRIYKEPYKFDPERFSPERVVDYERFSFLPFSGGPRNCIAKTYAMQLVKTIVVHVLRRYKLSTDMDITRLRKKLSVVLLNADGYNISLQERN